MLNDKHISNSSHQSIVFLRYINVLLYIKKDFFELAEDIDITPIDLAAYFWKSAKSPKLVEEQVKKVFKSLGYL